MHSQKNPVRVARSRDGFVESKLAHPQPSVQRPQLQRPTAPNVSASQLSAYMKPATSKPITAHHGSSQQIPIRRANMQPAANSAGMPKLKNSSAIFSSVDGMTMRRPSRPELSEAPRQSRRLHAPEAIENSTSNDEPIIKGSARQERKARRSKKVHKHPKLRKIIIRSSGILGALVLLIGGFLGWKFFDNTSKTFGGNILSNIGAIASNTPLKGQESGRVNILLAGDSSDQAGHGGAQLTDSIMVISMDTENNKAFMLSIPRDLWVNIPGVGFRKINEASYWGEQNNFKEDGFPDGGMGLLEKTLETTFELDIQYYALINYTAFKDSVNAVGGVTVNIESSDAHGLYDPTFKSWEGGALKLSNGEHELDGTTALKLARARGHDGGYGFAQSDFMRTTNQRKLLLALKDKALSAGTLSNPIKISKLLDSIGDNIKTDFKLNEIKTLVGLAGDIKNVESLSFQGDEVKLLSNYTSPTGQSALAPSAGVGNYEAIVVFLRQKMSNDPVVQEAAKVTVMNGTQISGLAKTQQAILEEKGLNVISIASSVSSYAKTTIIDVHGSAKPGTKAYLKKTYKNAEVTTKAVEVIPDGVDFVIIIGEDFTPTS